MRFRKKRRRGFTLPPIGITFLLQIYLMHEKSEEGFIIKEKQGFARFVIKAKRLNFLFCWQ